MKVLHERAGRRGEPLRTTLDRHVQEAAEGALGEGSDSAALVAIAPTSGDLLAVANRPVDNSFNRALEGQYPPGSTFKVVSTSALLEAGLDPGEPVACPQTITVGGRRFRNFEGSAHGVVPFREDFAQSCNTAFVSLTDRLRQGDLRKAGRRFGLGRKYELPLAVFAGQVPEPRSEAERGEAIIGQARVLASPLAMAGVAGTVAAGRWWRPRLVASDAHGSGPRLAGDAARTLRALMREVVKRGTGTAASRPGGVAGKTGTAEFGGGNPPRTHAWFIGFRGDVATAVLVEDAASGGEVAAPIAGDFFGRLAAGG